MPTAGKVFFTGALCVIAACIFGAATVGDDRLQRVAKASVAASAFVALTGVIAWVWSL